MQAQLIDPLELLQRRLAVVRDRVRGVGLRLNTGFYLFGRPGTSKTYTVRKTLDEMGVPYEYHLGHLTAMGLFDLLAKFHDRVIALDDVAQIFGNKTALQILLAALGNQPDETGVRIIKYRRQGHDESIRFTGGIIAISNLELNSEPLLEALKSRVHYLKYDPTDEQITALMLDISQKGWPARRSLLSSRECTEVAEFVIAESTRLNVRPDMRLLVDKAFPDYHQHRSGQTEAHWKDLVLTTLEEQLVDLAHTPALGKRRSRANQKAHEHEIIMDLMEEFDTREDRVQAWMERTGKSGRAYYRRLEELGEA